MFANWKGALPKLRIAMEKHGLRLPDIPVIDGRWRCCEHIDRHANGIGRYLIFPTPPACALFRAEGQAPVAWYGDADRILTMWQQQRSAHAMARLPPIAPVAHRPNPKSNPQPIRAPYQSDDARSDFTEQAATAANRAVARGAGVALLSTLR